LRNLAKKLQRKSCPKLLVMQRLPSATNKATMNRIFMCHRARNGGVRRVISFSSAVDKRMDEKQKEYREKKEV
jgi:hypothetical protein